MSAQKYKIDLGSAIAADLSAPSEAEPGPAVEDKPAAPASARPAAPPGLPSGPPEPMSVEEVAATPKADRKQLNIAPPKRLDLHRRAALYRMAHGVDIQDQGALALDAWLRDQGF